MLCKIKVVIPNEMLFASKWSQLKSIYLLWEKFTFTLIHLKVLLKLIYWKNNRLEDAKYNMTKHIVFCPSAS